MIFWIAICVVFGGVCYLGGCGWVVCGAVLVGAGGYLLGLPGCFSLVYGFWAT